MPAGLDAKLAALSIDDRVWLHDVYGRARARCGQRLLVAGGASAFLFCVLIALTPPRGDFAGLVHELTLIFLGLGLVATALFAIQYCSGPRVLGEAAEMLARTAPDDDASRDWIADVIGRKFM